MLLRKLLLSIILLLIFTCSFGRSLDEIKRSGKIYMAFTSDDLNNINYDLALEFARYLNVEMIVVEIDWDEVFMRNGMIPPDLETNPDLSYTPDALKKADIICSTFTVTEWRKRLFGFAETLYSAELLLIKNDRPLPDDFQDLAGKRIAFVGSTTFEKNLKEINRTISGNMELVATETSAETQQLLNDDKVYGIVLDADEALNFNAENGHQYNIAFPISQVTKTAWAVEKNNPLIQEVEQFFETIASNNVLDDIFFQRFGIRYSTYIDKINKNLRLEICHRNLDEILASGKLVVALRERNFIYRENGQKQFMHALAEEFADYLGVSLEFVITPYFGKYWETENGEIFRDSSYTPDWFNYFDLACEVIAPLEWRTNKVDLIPVYPSSYTVIAKKGTEIHSLEDLKGLKGVTDRESIYEEILLDNGIDNFYYERVNNFLPDVASGKADYTIIYDAFMQLSDYPDLEAKLELGDLMVSWALRKDQPELEKKVQEFITKSTDNGMIRLLLKALKGNTLQAPEAFIHSYYESFQTGQLPYVNYGADDGLPQEDIFSIFQDKKGYMWFGTNSGAVRYNGREMIVFNHENGLLDNSVRDIKQDSSGLMYFATSNGIAKFDEDTVVETILQGISFNKLYIDSKNNKWMIGDDGVYLETGRGIIRSINAEFPELPELVYSVTEEPGTGRILFATVQGVYLFDEEVPSVTRLSDEDCFSLYVDVNDSIWISTRDGLFISALSDLIEDKFKAPASNLNRRLHFPVNIISDITTNRFGSVWLVSDSKIMQVISTDQEPVIYEQEIGIKNNKILSFLVDQEDNIWIGFSGGLQRLTNRKGLRNFYPSTIDSYIYSLFQDPYNRIWITSDNGIFYFINHQLTNFTPQTGNNNKKFVGTLLPDNNILIANTEGLYEVSSRNLEIIRHTIFNEVAHSPENIFVSAKGEIFLLTGIQGIIYYFPNFYSQPIQLKNKYTSNIFQLIEYNGQVIGGNNTGLVTFNGKEFELLHPLECNVWSLKNIRNDLWVGTDCGIGLAKQGRLVQLQLFPLDKDLVIKSIYPAKKNDYLWLGTNNGFSYFNAKSHKIEFTINAKDGLSGDEITSGGLFIDRNDLLWIGTYHGVSNFNIRAQSPGSYAPVCYIESLTLNGEPIDVHDHQVFAHDENNLVFEISALSFSDEASVEYEFYLRGTGNNYSSYNRGKEYKAYYTNLPPGKYEFIYKAKGKNNIWGYAESYSFQIRKAWYNTWIFRSLAILILISATYLVYLIRIRTIKAQKKLLEQLVRERTRELEDANAEIEAQRDLARNQRDQIAVHQKAIMDSIHYAQKIQDSLLPGEQVLDDLLPEHFILYKPRDIVSGDFYWVREQDHFIYLAAADCTGHGVPGAFMSMLGMTLLNEIVSKNHGPEPEQVLDDLRQNIISTLQQKGEPGESKDGMDMVLCRIDNRNNKLHFAGANNPLYLVRNKEIAEYKTDNMPVAIHEVMDPFRGFEIDLRPGDNIYIFSDGYVDQFGGPKEKKFMYRQFKELLVSSSEMDMVKQGRLLDTTFEKWKGEIEQIDDVIVIGLKF